MANVEHFLDEVLKDVQVVSGRMIGEDRFAYVILLTFGCARICLSDSGSKAECLVSDSWDYETIGKAVGSLGSWDPATQAEPSGWIRNASTGRRRPYGDQKLEYVQY